MFCVECQTDVALCKCPDIEERLRSIAKSPNWQLTYCDKCKKYWSRCDCERIKH